jgi:group I intron endonuclease
VIKFCNKEDVRFWEQYYIDLFHPYFNIRSSVEGHIITHHTEESKLKISKNNARYWKNKKRSKETISKLKEVKGERHWAWGTKRSVEFGKLISKAKKGTKTSEEVRLKQAISKGAKKFSVFKKDTGEFVATYVNRSRCSRELGLLYSKVCACLRGVRKSHKGYVFEYND